MPWRDTLVVDEMSVNTVGRGRSTIRKYLQLTLFLFARRADMENLVIGPNRTAGGEAPSCEGLLSLPSRIHMSTLKQQPKPCKHDHTEEEWGGRSYH